MLELGLIIITLFLIAAGSFCLVLYNKTKGDVIKQNKSKEYFANQMKWFESLTGLKAFQKIDKYLKEAGNPYGITLQLYLLISVATIATGVFVIITKGSSEAVGILLMTIIPFNLLIYFSHKRRIANIRIALCDLQDMIYMQSKIGTPTDVILANASQLAREPLKEPIEKMATTYKVTRNLEQAVEVLLGASNIIEVQAFAFILKQKEKTGFSEQNIKAQSIMLKRNKRLKKKLERELRRNKLILAAILLFICYIFMFVYPVLKEAFMSLRMIL